MMHECRVLIFPAGTEIAFEIVNALKYSKFVKLYGGTSVQDHSEFVFKNLITDFPYVWENGFLEYLNEVISQYKIECVYPAHDSVGVFLSEHIGEIKAQVITSDCYTMRICRSKKETYSYFAGEWFIPKTYESAEDVKQFPVFVKPIVGQGSDGARKIESEIDLKWAIGMGEPLVICEYLPGTEYTVDCFTDRHRVLRTVKLRDRERIRNGISVRSMNILTDSKVYEIADKLNQKLHFRGAWFFQLRKNKDGEYRLLEISPRIPGTMGLSRNVGINFPMLTLFDFWGYDVDILDNQYSILVDRAFYNAYKVGWEFSHIYIDYDDTLIVKGKVNSFLIMFLYQQVGKGKSIHLLSKHFGDLCADLKRNKIAENLFDEIILVGEQEEKKIYITERSAIFIDDSFAERQRVSDYCKIPVFDLDMVESLIDWRR